MLQLKKHPKITVVTPNYNQGDYIEETINSVLNQNYPNLEYIIIDGGSTDGSLDIIKKHEQSLYYWISEQDNGMYHAINKGFSKSTGDIMCWINSDDILHENSLFIISKLMSVNKNINWIQGFPNVINESGVSIYEREQVFSKYFFYWDKHKTTFSFIQQESTFWTRELWEKSGGNIDVSYKLAADFDLWMRFFKFEKMYCTQVKLGAFRKREGQKSSDRGLYLQETEMSLTKNYRRLKLSHKFIVKLGAYLQRFNFPLIKKVVLKFQVLFIGKPRYVK